MIREESPIAGRAERTLLTVSGLLLGASVSFPWIRDSRGSFPSFRLLDVFHPQANYAVVFLVLAAGLSVRGHSKKQRRLGRWLAVPALAIFGGLAIYTLINADSLIHVYDAMQPHRYAPAAGPIFASLGVAALGTGLRLGARRDTEVSDRASP